MLNENILTTIYSILCNKETVACGGTKTYV